MRRVEDDGRYVGFLEITLAKAVPAGMKSGIAVCCRVLRKRKRLTSNDPIESDAALGHDRITGEFRAASLPIEIWRFSSTSLCQTTTVTLVPTEEPVCEQSK
jgi:hypothetical protein